MGHFPWQTVSHNLAGPFPLGGAAAGGAGPWQCRLRMNKKPQGVNQKYLGLLLGLLK